ncbi:hypothetical protein BDZ94DRAFT_268757 [Collybia nuda]|uniref:Uncharacterized protein n=1 Tax=Collybia nuda TaxID=64659 RepID=A0A9P6CDK4_9AGAR|nr:hypothetical protein BDZ94DRAFT_268757 [Collybia nuda]
MVVLFPAVRRVNNPLYRRQTIRVFHSFSPCQAVGKNASTSAKRTVKAFAEMPSVLLRPDGNIATPLGKWQGGLDKSPSTSVECRSRANACNPRDYPQKSAESLALSNNPRGRKSRRIQKLNEESEQLTGIVYFILNPDHRTLNKMIRR